MNNILSELEFEDYIIERLVQGNGYIERDHTYYDDKFAADRELLMRFLSETQPETMAQLKKVFKDKLEDTLIATINAEATKERGSLLSVLKHGIELANFKLDLLYQKPATTFNRDAAVRYQKNIFSVMKEMGERQRARRSRRLYQRARSYHHRAKMQSGRAVVCGRDHPIPHRAQPENAAFPL